MTYRQLSPEERYMLAALRRQGLNRAEIARLLGRHRSTVGREVRPNSTRADGHYRATTAQERTNGRRSRSRRNRRFSAEDFALVDGLLSRLWSPEQVAGHLARAGLLSDQQQQFREGVRAAVRANAAEISARRRWLTISRRHSVA